MCRAPLKISLLSGLPVEILQLQLQYLAVYQITILFYLKKQSSSLSLNDLNCLEPCGCKLIRLTGRAIQVSDEADKKFRKFSTSEF